MWKTNKNSKFKGKIFGTILVNVLHTDVWCSHLSGLESDLIDREDHPKDQMKIGRENALLLTSLPGQKIYLSFWHFSAASTLCPSLFSLFNFWCLRIHPLISLSNNHWNLRSARNSFKPLNFESVLTHSIGIFGFGLTGSMPPLFFYWNCFERDESGFTPSWSLFWPDGHLKRALLFLWRKSVLI